MWQADREATSNSSGLYRITRNAGSDEPGMIGFTFSSSFVGAIASPSWQFLTCIPSPFYVNLVMVRFMMGCHASCDPMTWKFIVTASSSESPKQATTCHASKNSDPVLHPLPGC